MVIYLTGFMGSGKSTLGKKLSNLAGIPFIDLDAEIERSEGLSTEAIFARKGEMYFRESESLALRSVNTERGAVIATGGGAPCYNQNMEFMNQTGITVYLRLPAAALVSRLEAARGRRPLIEGLSGPELLSFVESKLIEREPYYMQAKVVFEGLSQDPAKLLHEIKSAGQSDSK